MEQPDQLPDYVILLSEEVFYRTQTSIKSRTFPMLVVRSVERWEL